MAKNFDIGLLRTFVAIVDLGSVTAAAARLHLSQSAVSQQLRRLEILLQAQLLIRDHLGARPTAAGDRLLGRAREMIALNDQLWTEMTAGAVAGRIRLGAPEDLVSGTLHSVLRRFSSAYPTVEISLFAAPSTEVAKALERGLIDIALVEELGETSRFEHLRSEPLVWIGAAGGVAHERHPLPVSFAAADCVFRPAVESALASPNRAWKSVVDSEGTESTLAAIRADLAVGVWLQSMIPDGLQMITEAALPSLPPVAIGLGLPVRHPPSPAALALAQELRGG